MRTVILSLCLLLVAASDEIVGKRPYEMVRSGRVSPHAPLVGFDSLDGWQVTGASGATGQLSQSQEQRVWESPVARLAYRGSSKESELSVTPPIPVPIPEPYSAVTLWVYGNNWGWEPDPTTPQVQLLLLLKDKDGTPLSLDLDRVRWKEWWLIHRVVPPEVMKRKPLSFAGLLVKGCANTEERRLYFEDLDFYQEKQTPLAFEPRPSRPIAPFPGQTHGANTGPGRLPFPTRDQTILPENSTRKFTTAVQPGTGGFVLRYAGEDTVVEYALSPREPFFRNIEARLNGKRVASVWCDAGPEFGEQPLRIESTGLEQSGDAIQGSWKVALSNRTVDVRMAARIWQKSLVLDVLCPEGAARELSYGWIRDAAQPELILLPYLNYGSHHLNVLMSHGPVPFFASVWMDWYRSNASVPYAEDKIEGARVRLNGGVRYEPKTDGTRNGLFERVFLTVTPRFEETLPTIANPPARSGKEAGTRLWQESWGPEDYTKEHERSRRLHAYGIEKLTQCNHEITWRDGGESFTFRTVAAPGKGGDDALRKYVAAQQSLGWRSGLYTNYCDFAPVNEYWDPDMVMRNSAGDLVRAWPRCYSPKALFAVQMDRKLAPEIVKKFNSDAAYTDVHTSVSPWERCDYDARVPGAGTFAATYYAYGEILLNDQEVYKNHCWSEGHHQWLYAGLTTGNYGLTYSDLKLWEYPYLPHFDLLEMHPLSVDIGVPWTAQFFHGKEGWDKPEQIVRSIDQFIAATIAYGHMGWLVEEKHGIRRTCRSYYMLQQLQSRYLMEKLSAIRYGTDQGLVSSSRAFLDGAWKQARLNLAYANGLEIFVNGNAEKPWTVQWNGKKHTLPPFGWLAASGHDFFTSSSLVGGTRVDRVSAPEYVFLDGRGSYQEFDGIGTAGSVAVLPAVNGAGVTVIAVDGVDGLSISPVTPRRSAGDLRNRISTVARSGSISVRAIGIEGKILGERTLDRASDWVKGKWRIPVVAGAVRYDVVPAQDRKTPRDLVFPSKAGDIAFTHAAHVKRQGTCATCHDNLWPQSTSVALTSSDGCKTCHHAEGKSFEMKGNCARCHAQRNP